MTKEIIREGDISFDRKVTPVILPKKVVSE